MTQNEKDFFQRLGRRIAGLRKERGITQLELAQILGVSQQSITSFEKGRRKIPVYLLPPLAKALTVSVEDVLGEAQQPKKRGPAPRLLQQMECIHQLPKAKQRFVLQMLDAVLRPTSE